MNIEKIGELAEQAGFMDGWFSESGDDCELQIMLFAELIVKECLDEVEIRVPHLQANFINAKIKQRFE